MNAKDKFISYTPEFVSSKELLPKLGGYDLLAGRETCIIGMKVATEIFKDGDLVEVDANNGIVWKL